MKIIPYLTLCGGGSLVIFLATVPTYHEAADWILALIALIALVPIGILEIRRQRDRAAWEARQYGSVDPTIGRGCAPLPGFVPPKPKPRKIEYGGPKRS